MEPNFSGYATKAGLKCTDGRTITADAFKHQDKMTVPLVWQHGHASADNVLGHAVLEARADGIYAYGYFNSTPNGENAKKLVEHKDITKLSIWANGLVEKMIAGSKQVLHGAIKEVSLVLAGANPGAEIDYVSIRHSDDTVETLEDEAIITTGFDVVLEHTDEGVPLGEVPSEDEGVQHAAGSEPTIQEVYDGLTDQQKTVVDFMIGAALEAAGTGGSSAAHTELGEGVTPQDLYDGMSDDQKRVVHSMIEAAKAEAKTEAVAEHSALSQEGNTNVNVFESQTQSANDLRHSAMIKARKELTPERIANIVADAQKPGSSLKESFLAHAVEYGIEDIDLLFPDARMDGNGISVISRRMEWVNNVLSGTKHSPFSRIKSLATDITADEARAKGYVKGTMKKDEVIKLLRRTTGPKTIYKKQKLDRDDIVDIVDLDIVAWLKAEMRVMLDEEIARAVLVSDGRESDDPDKIDEDCIRPIAYDVDMYNTTIPLTNAVLDDPSAFIDAVVTASRNYKGSGTPTLYTTTQFVTPLILAKDQLGRRLYNTMQELAAALRVKDIVEVEAMEQDSDLVGVVVNLSDYTIGADAGGNVAMFDDFDIDFNQQKYLIETRISGALTKPKSAITFTRDSGHTVTPATPTFVSGTGVVTIPNTAGVVYHNADTNAVLASGPQTAIAAGATLNVEAAPAAGFGFTHDAEQEWSFTRPSS